MSQHDNAGDSDDFSGDSTTELDRSALDGIASMGLPFAGTPEPVRAPPPSHEDGALPFRTAAPSVPPPPILQPQPQPSPIQQPQPQPQPSPILPPQPSRQPQSQPFPQPSLQSSPSLQSTPSLQPQPPPMVQSQQLPARQPTLQSGAAPPRTEVGDLFRRAFGLAGAEPPASAPEPVRSEPPASSRPVERSPAPLPSPSSIASLSSIARPAMEPALVSARLASDAALPPEVRASAAESRIVPANALRRRAVVDLIAFDPEVPARLRRSKVHAPVLAAPLGPRTHSGIDAPAGETSAEDKARADVLRVMSCGSPIAAEALSIAFDELLDEPGELDIPLFLVEGDVRPTMDEVEALRVAVDHGKPLAGANKRMLAALAAAGDALGRTTPPPPEAAIALYRQLDAATGELGLPPRHLAELVDRTLREARSYKRRTLLGAPRLRAELTLGRTTLPLYLPEAVADKIPLLSAFRLSALVESRPREDAAESSPTALIAFAVGRVLHARA